MADLDIHTVADPVVARDIVFGTFSSNQFTVTQTGEFTATVERGSKTATILFGALAGKSKQHLRYDVSFFTAPQGGTMVHLVSTTSGAAAGVVGMNRERAAFALWQGTINAALPH